MVKDCIGIKMSATALKPVFVPKMAMVDQTMWRWNRIIELYDTSSAPRPPVDDEFVKKGLRFWTEFKTASGDAIAEREVELRFTPQYRAYVLKVCASHLVRSVVEARLLSGESPVAIANAFSEGKDTIVWYEALFYDVKMSRSMSQDAKIAVHAGEAMDSVKNIKSTEGILKYMATISPELMKTFTAKEHMTNPTARKKMQSLVRAILTDKAVVASITASTMGESGLGLLTTAADYERIDIMAAQTQTDEQTNRVQQFVTALVHQAIEWGVMKPGQLPEGLHDETAKIKQLVKKD